MNPFEKQKFDFRHSFEPKTISITVCHIKLNEKFLHCSPLPFSLSVTLHVERISLCCNLPQSDSAKITPISCFTGSHQHVDGTIGTWQPVVWRCSESNRFATIRRQNHNQFTLFANGFAFVTGKLCANCVWCGPFDYYFHWYIRNERLKPEREGERERRNKSRERIQSIKKNASLWMPPKHGHSHPTIGKHVSTRVHCSCECISIIRS